MYIINVSILAVSPHRKNNNNNNNDNHYYYHSYLIIPLTRCIVMICSKRLDLAAAAVSRVRRTDPVNALRPSGRAHRTMIKLKISRRTSSLLGIPARRQLWFEESFVLRFIFLFFTTRARPCRVSKVGGPEFNDNIIIIPRTTRNRFLVGI